MLRTATLTFAISAALGLAGVAQAQSTTPPEDPTNAQLEQNTTSSGYGVDLLTGAGRLGVSRTVAEAFTRTALSYPSEAAAEAPGLVQER